jgi:D-beta-D-heptose 7-phosphate kinase/D-beta-D-heptose 1-phosphate adenosyltransferase
MTLRDRLAAFAGRRVLLLGESILDVFTYGSAIGLAAETPTLVIRRERQETTLGGAAFVCRNLLALGARVDFVTLVGDDPEAATVRAFSSPGLDLIAIADPARPTTVKQRFWAADHKLLQVDVRDDTPVGEAIADRIRAAVTARLGAADVLVVSDYRHGMIPPDLAPWLVAAARAAGKPVFVDSQVAQTEGNHTLYRSGAIHCLNLREARTIDPAFTPSDAQAAFAGLWRALEPAALVVKLGEDGAVAFNGATVTRARSLSVAAIDTTGAGDAFLAALVLAGLDDPAAALGLANAWAGLSVTLPGTATPSITDLCAAVVART